MLPKEYLKKILGLVNELNKTSYLKRLVDDYGITKYEQIVPQEDGSKIIVTIEKKGAEKWKWQKTTKLF